MRRILVWHFRSFQHKRRRMRGWHADPEFPVAIVLLRSPREVRRWFAALPDRSGADQA